MVFITIAPNWRHRRSNCLAAADAGLHAGARLHRALAHGVSAAGSAKPDANALHALGSLRARERVELAVLAAACRHRLFLARHRRRRRRPRQRRSALRRNLCFSARRGPDRRCRAVDLGGRERVLLRKRAEELGHAPLHRAHRRHLLDQVVAHRLRHHRVLLVPRVRDHKLAQPRGRCRDLPRRARRHKVEVHFQPRTRLRRALLAAQVGANEVDKADDVGCSVAVDDLVHAELRDLGVRVDILGAGDAGAEVKLFSERSAAAVRARHVGVDLRDGHVEVELLRLDGLRKEDHERRERCVLKVRDVDLHRAELDAPLDIVRVLRRGRLEAHRVPVRRLDVLEVVVVQLVVLLQLLAVHHKRVAHEEVRHMLRHRLVHASLHQPRHRLLVDRHRHIVHARAIQRRVRNVCVNRRVARLVDPLLAPLRLRQPALAASAVVH
mmetsp:Transcript_10744/g.25681  ORF Transcript_10744/g.25681 Transcript_10744/m.25681 type:complete len:439 (-) Transcript_10744:1051-2367(-)